MRLVIDTGILISALIKSGTPPDVLYQTWMKGYYELLTSEYQLAEFKRVINYPKLVKFLSKEDAELFALSLEKYSILIENIKAVHYSKDPDDNNIIAIAISGNADLIVSGDKRDMLSLKIVKNIPIISAREALIKLGINL